MKAAIFCRVSTDNQEKEGTSLQTQLENCLAYCQQKGYEAAYRFSEPYSGLSLERPELDRLRELVRNDVIDIIVCYSLDRLSRDPVHGVIITQELDKHDVALEAVTETIDSTEVGKLITYIRGFASKLEAEKIRERTMRGRKARAQQGRVPVGGYSKLYGYDYIKVSEANGGRRVLNENEAQWVRQMFDWLVNDGMSCRAIAVKLNSLQIPTKHGNCWSRKVVHQILSNVAYTGVTIYHHQGEPVELSNITPPIVDRTLFGLAQQQLRTNFEKAKRNMRRQYLLHGHIRCRQCGRPYSTHITNQRTKHKTYKYRRYICCRNVRAPDGFQVNRCYNKGWAADKLEALVWTQIERILADPKLIIAEIEKKQRRVGDISHLQTEVRQIERRLKAIDREQTQLLQWAIKGFPEDMVEMENRKLNSKRESFKAQKAELEHKVKASQEAAISLPKLEHFVELVREKLSALDFETKRVALDMLDIKVWIDGCNVEVTGVIPISDYAIVSPQSD
ncbi:MAG: recombinase family protein [Chloroflexota bacterium]|nr:MAG: recombinase family protein [Chloroflexota bacterium]